MSGEDCGLHGDEVRGPAGAADDPVPLQYQAYDALRSRLGWERAFERLVADVAAGRRPIDAEDFRRRAGLPREWDWEMVRRRIAESPSPEQAFDRLLNQLYQGCPRAVGEGPKPGGLPG